MPTEAEKRADNDRLIQTYKDERARLQAKKNKTRADETRILRLNELVSARSNVLFRDAKTAAWTAERSRQFSAGQRTPTTSSYARRLGRVAVEARKVGDGQTTAYGVSAQTKAKRDQIRQMMGLGAAFEAAGFMNQDVQLDANGEPVVDAQGRPISAGYSTSAEFDGFRFGPPSVGGGQRSGSNLKGRNLSMLTGMSVKDVMDFYYSLNGDELVKVQTQLADAGLYGDGKPTFGYRDDATNQALTSLMQVWAANPDAGLNDVLGTLKRENNAALQEKIREMTGESLDDEDLRRTTNLTFTDGATLDRMVDEIAIELFGGKIDPQRKAQLVTKLQQQEKDHKTGQAQSDYAADVANTKAQKKAANPQGSELDQFIAALIGQESGGDPTAVNSMTGAAGLGQIMGDNWGPWAREAGADPGDFSADNQMKVIRYQVAKYYQQFGNWRDVAYAWYGGGGAPAKIAAGEWSATREQDGGYPSFNSYADSILSKMGQITSGQLQANTPQIGLTVNAQEDLPDARTRIEAELRAADPERFFGTQFYKQWQGFASLLRGPV